MINSHIPCNTSSPIHGHTIRSKAPTGPKAPEPNKCVQLATLSGSISLGLCFFHRQRKLPQPESTLGLGRPAAAQTFTVQFGFVRNCHIVLPFSELVDQRIYVVAYGSVLK